MISQQDNQILKGEQSDWVAEALREIKNGNERAVEMNLVEPLLVEELKFDKLREIDANTERGGGRPDYVCTKQGAVRPFLIVECKAPGKPLLPRRSGPQHQAYEDSPAGQTQQYLNGDYTTTEGTWGICTNGADWIVVRKGAGPIGPVPFFENYYEGVGTLVRLREVLSDVFDDRKKDLAAMPSAKPSAPPPETTWPDKIADADSPEALIRCCLPHPLSIPSIEKQPVAGGSAAYAEVGTHAMQHATLGIQQTTYFVCAELALPDGISHPSVILSDKCVPRLIAELRERPSGGVGIVYGDDHRQQRWARGFAWDESNCSLTALVRPRLPGTRTAQQFEALEACTKGDPLQGALDRLLKTTEELRGEFYTDIEKWFKGGQKGRPELVHLVRILFTWLLQEHGVLPPESMWQPGREFRHEYDIDDHLQWLFMDILAVPEKDRDCKGGSGDPWLENLRKNVPFLNGSLFTKLKPCEKSNPMKNDRYWNERTGLFPILYRYEWTLSDRTGYASESALDPSLLGSIFEQLIVITDGVRKSGQKGKSDQMPFGAYYTPEDVATEMASDAIAGWLHARVPEAPWREAKALAHPVRDGEPWSRWNDALRSKAMKALRRLTVLDPCCGSGAFVIAVLHALRHCQERLGGTGKPSSRTIESIIEKQLYAADLHPIAVLITRLRLFIAWVENWSFAKEADGRTPEPMPNLETRCRPVNTLCVNLSANLWLGGAESHAVRDAFSELRAADEALITAHGAEDKQYVQEERGKAIQRVIGVTSGGLSPGMDMTPMEVDVFSMPKRGVEADVRLLFPAPDFPSEREGWDLVIGNPPYQSPGTGQKQKLLAKYGPKGLGYSGAGVDLYLMFIEAALHVAKPDGCISLIVPHSIAFRTNNSVASPKERSPSAYEKVRSLLEEKSQKIDIRTYDIRPAPVFPNPKWVKGENKSNYQRVTILTALKGEARKANQPVVHSGGLIRLNEAGRESILRQARKGHPQPRWQHQWTQAPTEPLVQLLEAMHGGAGGGGQTNRDRSGKAVTFPATARYFITCLPRNPKDVGLNRLPHRHQAIFDQPRRKEYCLPDDLLYPWLGLYNSRLFHAFWLMVGDAFDLNHKEYGAVRKPSGWGEDANLRKETEDAARELMSADILETCYRPPDSGRKPPNYDFHTQGFHAKKEPRSKAPELIEELDKLLLKAYGLDEEPLLSQMETIVYGSSHELFLPDKPARD